VSKRDNALDIDIDYLRQRLRYEPETGKLYWLHYESMPKGWLTKYASKEAFTCRYGCGYKQGAVDNKLFLAHRVAWALYYGVWPKESIDHINGLPEDNRIVNLREVSHQENQRNKKKHSTNTSGVCGISWDKKSHKWHAYINVRGDVKRKNLGWFSNLEEAIRARKEAEMKYEFHENHGRD